MILKLLNWQGIAGIALSLALAVMLAIQKGETHHWKKASAGFEQLYHQDQAAFARPSPTIARARTRPAPPTRPTHARRRRAAEHQQRTANDYEARLAAARADAQRLRLDPEGAADPRAGRGAPMPSLSATARGLLKPPAKTDFLHPTR